MTRPFGRGWENVSAKPGAHMHIEYDEWLNTFVLSSVFVCTKNHEC